VSTPTARTVVPVLAREKSNHDHGKCACLSVSISFNANNQSKLTTKKKLFVLPYSDCLTAQQLLLTQTLEANRAIWVGVRSAVDAVEQQRPPDQAQPTTPIVRRTETTTANAIEDADAGAGADADAAVSADSSSLSPADAIEQRQPLEVIQAVVQARPTRWRARYRRAKICRCTWSGAIRTRCAWSGSAALREDTRDGWRRLHVDAARRACPARTSNTPRTGTRPRSDEGPAWDGCPCTWPPRFIETILMVFYDLACDHVTCSANEMIRRLEQSYRQGEREGWGIDAMAPVEGS
jgi:hypothetical protein